MIWKIMISLGIGSAISAGLIIFGGPGLEASGTILLVHILGILSGFIWSLRRAEDVTRVAYEKSLNSHCQKLQDKYDEIVADAHARYHTEGEKLLATGKKYDAAAAQLSEHYRLIWDFYQQLQSASDNPESSYDCNAYRESIRAAVFDLIDKVNTLKEK